ncbi:hypothetical protein BU16DRAFT_378185 [Lophium mytilinum]|uniref:CCHC-type domain-containing protein n=1 Tax=Lophium mytilinum TaxID=390894 RepID=A0A6A6QWD9_9PEZI|nr:hypothetical protein BU16DRAFT_378185 [Lophium mytilinum]
MAFHNRNDSAHNPKSPAYAQGGNQSYQEPDQAHQQPDQAPQQLGQASGAQSYRPPKYWTILDTEMTDVGGTPDHSKCIRCHQLRERHGGNCVGFLNCENKCYYCGSMGHVGKACQYLYASWDWWKQNTGPPIYTPGAELFSNEPAAQDSAAFLNQQPARAPQPPQQQGPLTWPPLVLALRSSSQPVPPPSSDAISVPQVALTQPHQALSGQGPAPQQPYGLVSPFALLSQLDAQFRTVMAERDQAITEKDRAITEKDQAIGERDQARRERDQARGEVTGQESYSTR